MNECIPTGLSRLPLNLYEKISQLKSLYSRDGLAAMTSRYKSQGIRRIGPPQDEEKGFVKIPFVYKNFRNVETIAFTPVRFHSFEGYTEKESWDLINHVMSYILTEDNIISHKWRDGQVGIFKNDELIHTSTPTMVYEHEKREHRLLFLPSKELQYDMEL